MRIAKNIKSVTDIIPNNVKLVAVSKTKSINLIDVKYDQKKAFKKKYIT